MKCFRTSQPSPTMYTMMLQTSWFTIQAMDAAFVSHLLNYFRPVYNLPSLPCSRTSSWTELSCSNRWSFAKKPPHCEKILHRARLGHRCLGKKTTSEHTYHHYH